MIFYSSSRASLAVLVVSVIAISAAPSLTVKTSVPNVNIDGLGNLKVTATITNTCNETLKLLNDPRGVLNPFPENSFSITGAAGSRPLFDGAKVKFSPTYAASLDDPSVFTVLDPGASIGVIHDLSAAYNFTLSGAGNYSIKPSNLFTYVDADGTPNDFYATVEDIVNVNLSGTLAVPRVYDKRATYSGCSLIQKAEINQAATDAQSYASESYYYIVRFRTTTARPLRYTTWFGVPYADDADTVQAHFRLINSGNFASFSYSCSCNEAGVYAYVYPSQYGKVYLCGAFWEAPNTGTDSRAGTLVHESSHFAVNGETDDFVYGQSDCKTLVLTNQAKAIFNADNHQYFAENEPYLS